MKEKQIDRLSPEEILLQVETDCNATIFATTRKICVVAMKKYAEQEVNFISGNNCVSGSADIIRKNKLMDKELNIVHQCLTDLYNDNERPNNAIRIRKCLDKIDKHCR